MRRSSDFRELACLINPSSAEKLFPYLGLYYPMLSNSRQTFGVKPINVWGKIIVARITVSYIMSRRPRKTSYPCPRI